jgi:hypothetical protein
MPMLKRRQNRTEQNKMMSEHDEIPEKGLYLRGRIKTRGE